MAARWRETHRVEEQHYAADVTIERPDMGRFHRDVNEPSRVFAPREIRLDAQVVEWNEVGLGAAERVVLSG